MDQFEKIENDMNDFGAPKQVKGGTFAPADMDILKRALHAYKDVLIMTEDNERVVSDELAKVANLLHRIRRIA